MPKGYWLATYKKIEDLEKLKKYAETVTPIIKGFDGQALVRGGKFQVLEGQSFVRTVISFCLTKVFGSRFAFLSVGVILGCIMFFNVFFVIIPNGKNITSSALNKEKFDLNLSISAKTRSVHNNIITFLVLFVMLSGHASFIWISKYNWLILAVLAILFGLIRYYFNWKNKKESN